MRFVTGRRKQHSDVKIPTLLELNINSIILYFESFLFLFFSRLGHADHEITAAFATFDRDGNHILDEEEQQQMKHDLEAKKVKKKRARKKIFCSVDITPKWPQESLGL